MDRFLPGETGHNGAKAPRSGKRRYVEVAASFKTGPIPLSTLMANDTVKTAFEP